MCVRMCVCVCTCTCVCECVCECECESVCVCVCCSSSSALPRRLSCHSGRDPGEFALGSVAVATRSVLPLFFIFFFCVKGRLEKQDGFRYLLRGNAGQSGRASTLRFPWGSIVCVCVCVYVCVCRWVSYSSSLSGGLSMPVC